jgi:YD repeat-containing protein
MKKQIITSICLSLLFLLGSSSPSFAVLQALPAASEPVNHRDKYQTDRFTGAATYSYPIKVPKGTNNLTPDVSLSYDNQAVHALPMHAGIGWQVDRDYIQRDVNYTPSNTSDDKFKLHFKGATYDLVYNSSDSLFHTAIESHLKIQQYLNGGQGSTGVYWQVTTTDGTIYRFGYASNSEFVCNGQSYDGYWNLDQVTDIHGNHIYYTYTNSSGVAYLNQIKYNNDQLREVDFTYATNPYQIPMYQQGCSVTEGSRLSAIQVKANGNLVHEYDLSFNQATNSQNLLSSITEKGTDGSSLPSTSFSYNSEVQSWNTQYSNWINNASVDVHLDETGSNGLSDMRLIDVNGDGLPDIVKSYQNGGNDTWKVLLNTGSGWSTTWQTWINNASADVHLDEADMQLIDVNGDGLPDIVKTTYSGSNDTWKVLLNTGSGWSTSWQTWINNASVDTRLDQANVRLIDVNGDGLPDIVKSTQNGGNDTWIVYKNTGSSWNTTAETWINNASVDVHLDEIGQNNLPDYSIIDVNGDGLPDIIKTVQNGGNDTWKVLINTGSGWSTTWQTWINNASVDVHLDENYSTMADVNGDGLPDIIKTVQNGGNDTWEVLYNLGNSWSTTWQTWLNNAPIDANLQMNDVRVADVNGDGLPDIIKTVQNGGNDTWEVWNNSGSAPDLLSSIQSAQRGTIQFQYSSSTQYSNTALPFPLWVVQSMTENNGLTNSQQTNDVTTYSYANGLYSWQNHEFRGFGQVNETDPNTAKKTYSFAQNDDTKGKLNELDTNDSQNNPYAKTVNTWSSSQSNGSYTVNLTQEKNYTYDGTASNPKIKETDYQYDTYGNITKKSELGDTGVSGDERYTYTAYTTNPTLWIVNTPSDTYINKADDATKVSETWNYYDNNANLTDAPSKGDLTKQVKWLSGGTNPTTTYTFDSYGNKTQETDANNHSTSWSYGTTDTTHTYPDSTTNAKSQTTSMTYDLGTGNLLSQTDPNNFTTSYTYDVFGRIAKEIKPYDTSGYPTTSYTYFDNTSAPQGTLVAKRKVSGQAGTLDAYTYIDGFVRTLQTRVPAEDTSKQIVTDTFYDPNGKVAKQSVPHLDTLTSAYATPVSGIESVNTAYDPVLRVVTITNPQGTTKTTAYDHWTQTNTDENGHNTKKYVDVFGNILQVDEHSAGLTFSTYYSYDPQNNLIQTTDVLGNITTYTFDSLNRLITMVDPDMGTYHYQYDGVGNQTQQTDNRGKSTTTTYDPLNRVATVSYPTDPNVTYTYDTNTIGTLAQVQDAVGTVTYAYDNRLRKTQEQRMTDGITWTTNYTYDATDRLVSTSKPDSEVVTNTYNAQGEVASTSGVLTNVDYNALGKVTGKTFTNGLTTNFTYSTTDFRLNRIQTGTVQDVGYTYDNVGNVASTTDNLLSKTQSFTYDNLNRLTAASQSYGSYNFTYTYNAIGNLTNYTGFGSTTQYGYGQNSLVHALSSATTNTIVYDDSFASGWTDASFNAVNSATTQSANVYKGTVALTSTIGANGGLDFQAPSGMTTDGSDTLHFVMKASQAGQEYEVYVDSIFGEPLSTPVSLANYGGQPNATGWTEYNIPFADLGANNVPLGDIVIHNPNAGDEQAVYIDQVELSDGIPAPGSEIKVSPASQSVAVGTPFTVDVIANSNAQAFNAAQATVTVSANLAITSLTTPASSSCNFTYSQAPTVNNPSFAGAIFGSSKTNCTVYRLTLIPTSAGTGSVTFTNAALKTYSDGVELTPIVQNGSYTISANPTPTPTPALSQLTVTSPALTYSGSFSLTGTKDSRVTNVFINGSSDGVSYPTSTTWQKTLTLSSGDNSLLLYSSDANGNQTASIKTTISLHALGDINGDGVVDLVDFSLFAADWGKTSNLTSILSDMNTDGTVDLTDYSTLAKLEAQ